MVQQGGVAGIQVLQRAGLKVARRDDELVIGGISHKRAARLSLECESRFFSIRIEIYDSLTILHTV